MNSMTKILIQPTITNFDKYAEYAKTNGFYFEIIDFAFPKILDEQKDEIIESYKSKIKAGESKIMSMHGAFWDLYLNSPDQKIKNVAERRIIDNLKTADELGIEYVVFHTNIFPMMGNPAYYDNWVSAQVNFWKKHLSKYNATVLLENMWDKTPELINKVLNEVNSENIKVCFDIGHYNVFSTVGMEDWFKVLGNKIVYIHINDNNEDKDSELPPGAGNIDWKMVDKLIKKYCDDLIFVLELKDLEYINQGVKYLKENTSFLNR